MEKEVKKTEEELNRELSRIEDHIAMLTMKDFYVNQDLSEATERYGSMLIPGVNVVHSQCLLTVLNCTFCSIV